MRILIVTNDFPPHIGGVDQYVAQIARRLTDHEVTIFTSTANGCAEFDRTFAHPVVRWPARVLLPTPAVRRGLRDLAARFRADVVLFGAAMPLGLLGRSLLRHLDIPYVTCTHGLEIAATRVPGGRALLRRIFRRAAAVTAVSRWTANILKPLVPPGTPVELLPAGVDVVRFRPDVRADVVLARHGIDTGPVITCVSRLVARKGQDQVIRALSRISAEFPGARLLVVGRGPDEGRLRSLAREWGVAGRVVFAGAVSDDELPQYFRAGDVFAAPCRHRLLGLDVEALGAVYLQAAGVARPSVAGRVGGVADAVEDGETGLLVDGTNLGQVEDALLALLRNPDRARAMGDRGAARVHGDFAWEQITARLVGLLQRAVAVGR